MNYTVKKATKKNFEYLYNHEAYCAEGLENASENFVHKALANIISGWEGCPENVSFYYCKGKDLNQYYHLTDDNAYNDELNIFFIDWSNFDLKYFDVAAHKGNLFRYFSDVVDNNARREIRKGNSNYEGYHSIYGDEWFYSTI